MQKLKSFLLKHEYLIWILSVCALLRLPSLLEPYWYGDEGIYLTLGTAIRHGLTLYKDIHDNKPPGVYFLAALAGSVFWFRFILLLWNSVAIIAFERLSHRLLDTKDHPGFTKILGIEFPNVTYSTVATALFALLPFLAEGAIANGEIFMIMPTILGMFFLYKGIVKSQSTFQAKDLLAAGLFFSLAFLFKVPALFDAIAAGFFFFIVYPFLRWREEKSSLSFGRFIRPILLFSVAFLLPIVLSFAYYSAKGVGKQYVSAAFAQNIGYLSSWSTGTHQASNVGSSGLKNRAMAFGAALVVLTLLAQKNGKKTTFLAIWFAAALFGALLAERPYPHYLIQVIPPVTLLFVHGLKTLRQKQLRSQLLPLVTVVVALTVLVVSIWKIQFWYYPLRPYYQNYLSFILKQKSRDSYFAHFDPNLPAMYAVSEHIASMTTENDRVFVWGDYPMIYALSRRLPPGRYTSSYHIKDFNGFEETLTALEKTQPKYIVVATSYEKPYPALGEFIRVNYMKSSSSGQFEVYRRLSR